jgi:hypothetical protein
MCMKVIYTQVSRPLTRRFEEKSMVLGPANAGIAALTYLRYYLCAPFHHRHHASDPNQIYGFYHRLDKIQAKVL